MTFLKNFSAEHKVLVEERSVDFVTGYTDNYIKVYIEDKNKEPRSFEDTFEEVMEKFLDMKKKPQRQLMKMLKTLRSGKDGASS